MKRFNTLAVASMVFAFTVMSGGVAGALAEVWIGHTSDGVSRYDHAGTLLGTFALGGGGYPTNSMTLVGSEIWFGGSNTILRYDASGSLLGTFMDGTHTATAMTAVPEPSTALLLGIGLASLAARREKR